jgi:hypothetical protein
VRAPTANRLVERSNLHCFAALSAASAALLLHYSTPCRPSVYPCLDGTGKGGAPRVLECILL